MLELEMLKFATFGVGEIDLQVKMAYHVFTTVVHMWV